MCLKAVHGNIMNKIIISLLNYNFLYLPLLSVDFPVICFIRQMKTVSKLCDELACGKFFNCDYYFFYLIVLLP